MFLSWLSFWVDRHAVPARISLVITCILSTMFLFESINSSLPRISYLKAVDYYLITSFVFIVSCMVEYVCVLNFPDKASALLRSQSLAPVSLFSFLKELRHGLTVWKVQPKFFNFVVCNPCQSSPSLTILVSSLFIISLWHFSIVCKVLFSSFLQFKGNFVDGQNYVRDFATLRADPASWQWFRCFGFASQQIPS